MRQHSTKEFVKMLTLTPSSSFDTSMEALCSNKAQHIGVAKVRHSPQMKTLSGVDNHGNLLKVPFRSKLFIMIGVTTENKNYLSHLKNYINVAICSMISKQSKKKKKGTTPNPGVFN